MRNISFALTTAQFRARTKTVTRRRGRFWVKAAPVGTVLCGVEKAQGITKGGLVRLGTIRVVDLGVECLSVLYNFPSYGAEEMVKEGFPDMHPAAFVDMFLRHMGGKPNDEITRIEFEYVLCNCHHADVEHGDVGCDFCPCQASRCGFHRI